MSLKRLVLLSWPLTVLALVSSAFYATDRTAVTDPCCSEVAALSLASVAEAEPADVEDPELVAAAANWTFYGCIQLGQTCYDVFSDSNGTLWVCKECGTTRNPGPGKCRKLTAYEIQHSAWCS